jgi:predicted TIM-barrel fold metal-dependent hydrolase
MIAKAAKLGLPVHIHTGALGVTRPMDSVSPSKLDPFLWLPDIRPAKVVLLHGGYPFCREAGFMAGRAGDAPNLYLDISMMVFFLPGAPESIVGTLREWREAGLAEKMLYGSDGNNVLGMWMSAINARKALSLALQGMMDDGFIDGGQALAIANMILRENAKKLYGGAF